MRGIRHFLVALVLSRVVSELLLQAQALVDALTDNARFSNLTPTIAEVTAQISVLEGAETKARNKIVGASKVRDREQDKLVTLLNHWGDFVQHVADNDREHAQEIILSAGMKVKRSAGPNKPDFVARNGKSSGEVVLAVRRKARGSFEWQSSTDLKTWTNLPPSTQAKTVVRGFTPATYYYFRFRTVTKSGPGDWSDWTSLVVR